MRQRQTTVYSPPRDRPTQVPRPGLCVDRYVTGDQPWTVLPTYVAARDQVHSHGFEIAGRDDVNEYVDEIAVREFLRTQGRLIGRLSDMPAASTPGIINRQTCGFRLGWRRRSPVGPSTLTASPDLSQFSWPERHTHPASGFHKRSLFVPQRFHRLHACGAPRRNPACRQRNKYKQHRATR